MTLADRLRQSGVEVRPHTKTTSPLWKGPQDGGITFSLLSRFLTCRERFRLLVVEGLAADEGWDHRTGYGDMWHLCEQCHAAQELKKAPTWENALADHCAALCRKHPTQAQQIDHWYNVCRIQFPIYLRHWESWEVPEKRRSLLQEYVFEVKHYLPSGRYVTLRGKWDSVYLETTEHPGLWLMEHKTKGDIKEGQLKRQLTFDLQTMLYLVALGDEQRRLDDSTVKARTSYRKGQERHYYPLVGVLYNVVRRPLSGGKGTIVRHKPSKSNPLGETKEHYYDRVRSTIEEDPNHFFMRWKIGVTQADVKKFTRECLDPILEQLCDWWAWISKAKDPFSPNDGCEADGAKRLGSVEYDRPVHSSIHWRHPFGVYNVLDEGGSSDVDEYLATGSEVGLRRVSTLFPELST